MKQMSLGSTGFERKTKRTRKREFLGQDEFGGSLGRVGDADDSARTGA